MLPTDKAIDTIVECRVDNGGTNKRLSYCAKFYEVPLGEAFETSKGAMSYYGADFVENILSYNHLYFTSDEEIKEPCWIIASSLSEGDKLLYVENIPDNPKYFNMKGGYALFRSICKKIVATTDSNLLK